jgi:hypothetical protein
MNRRLYIGIMILLYLLAGSGSRLSAQFLRTHISIPPGIQLVSSGPPSLILPKGNEATMYSANSSKTQVAWVELRAMENLQVAVEYRALISLLPSAGKLLIPNDNSGDYSKAFVPENVGFVLDSSGAAPRRKSGLRPYTAWLGIPYQARSITTIHYP